MTDKIRNITSGTGIVGPAHDTNPVAERNIQPQPAESLPKDGTVDNRSALIRQIERNFSLHGLEAVTKLMGLLFPAAIVASIAYLILSDNPAQAHDSTLLGGAMMAFAKGTKGKKAGKATASPQPGPQAIRASSKVTTADHQLARVTEKGIEVNGSIKPFIVDITNVRGLIREGATSHDERAVRLLQMMTDLESGGDYESYLKFIIFMAVPDKLAFDAFSGLKNWTPEGLVKVIDSNYGRQFADAPPLPIENGIWTELIRKYDRYKADPSKVEDLDNFLRFYLKELSDKIRFSDEGIKLGPLMLSNKDILAVLYDVNEEALADMKKHRLFVSRREREAYRDRLKFIEVNTRAKAFFERKDVPDEIKERLAMASYASGQAGREPAVRLFENDVFNNSGIDEMKARVDELYARFVRPKIDGAGVKKSPPPRPLVKLPDVPLPKKWAELRGQDFVLGGRPQAPNRSYTAFRSPNYVMDLVRSAHRRLCRACRDTPEDRAPLEKMGFIMDFISDLRAGPLIAKDVSADIGLVRPMVMDILLQGPPVLFNIALDEFHRLIKDNQKNPRQLALSIREFYRKSVPYAEALLAQLKAEAAAREDPIEVAKGVLKKMTGGEGDVEKGWRSAQRYAPLPLRDRLEKVMIEALAAVDSDPKVYGPWFIWFSTLSQRPADWNWMEKENVLEHLQGVVYPVGGGAFIERPAVSLQALGYQADRAVWNGFVRASSFLLPVEWDGMLDAFAAMKEEINDAAKEFAARHPHEVPPREISQKKQMLQSVNLNGAFDGLSVMLNGGYGEDNAYLSRVLLKRAARSANELYSLLEFAHDAKLSRTKGEVLAAFDLIGQMVKTGKVNGDAVDLAMRVVFAGDDARWQGAMAELQTVMRFASKGNRVRILSPDVYMRDQTPDIMVETENGPVLVEVKSRKYFSATSSFEEVIQPALVNAAEQINAKARRHYGTVKGIISIHLLGSSEEDLVMEKIYDLVNRSRFSKEFGNIAGIEVNFISSSGSSKRGWPVKSFRLLSEYKPKKGGGGGSGNGGPAPVASSSGTSSGETAFAPIAGYEGDQAAAELSPAARAQLLQGSGAPTLMTGAAVYTGAPSATTAPAYIQLPIVP